MPVQRAMTSSMSSFVTSALTSASSLAASCIRKTAQRLVAGVGGVRQLDEGGVPLLDVALLAADAELDARAGLVNHVNGLVGQEAVGDVTVRLVDGRLQRVVRVAHLVESLVALAHAVQNLHGLGFGRRRHLDGLEAAL